ncbi:MAG: hypothetical protein HY528_04420 [Chloroflexi bacterium]|nr:hypothetical protein [Chloroflexota bacterium]
MAKITKAVARTRLADVPQEEKQFWCCNGSVLKSLAELKLALEQMSEETFCYHSSQTKSDFSNWVKDVIGDEMLAKDLSTSKTRAQAAKAVVDRILWLKNVK